jgi:DNA-binding NarL/FixJ family response regulator
MRIGIVNDVPLAREALRRAVLSVPGYHVAWVAEDGAAAVRLAAHDRPDVVLMDLVMPVMDGVEATRRLSGNSEPSGPRILVLTTFDADEHVVEAIRAGASGFLLKDVTPADFVAAIRVVAAGDALIAPSVTRRLLDRFARLPMPSDAIHGEALGQLTEREVEVLKLVAEGLSNREIADRLVLAEPTVKTHVSHLLLKLDLRDRAQLVVLAYETGLVRPGDSGG